MGTSQKQRNVGSRPRKEEEEDDDDDDDEEEEGHECPSELYAVVNFFGWSLVLLLHSFLDLIHCCRPALLVILLHLILRFC